MKKSIRAILCDLDGVITQTSEIHAQAWKILFDEFLSRYKQASGKTIPLFDVADDYLHFIDGKPRLEGIRSYLTHINIELPDTGSYSAQWDSSLQGLAERKNEIFHKLLDQRGVHMYQENINQLKKYKGQGARIAVVSASKNCRDILRSARLENFFDVIVDGILREKQDLKGKPEPDTFLYAAELLKTDPSDTMVVEDSLAGVKAGRKGDFGLVVGIVRGHNEDLLFREGADFAVNSLDDIEDEISLPMNQVTELFPSAWYILREGFNPQRERAIESIMAFGNGYFGSRNSLEEKYSSSEPSTFLSGIYQDIPGTNINELSRIPDWTRIQIFIDENIIDLMNSKILTHKRYLDLRKGLVVREWRSQDSMGRISQIEITKFISLSNKHLAIKSLKIKPENYSDEIKIVTGIDGKGIDSPISISNGNQTMLVMKTKDGSQSVSMYQRTNFNPVNGELKRKVHEQMVYEELTWMAELGKEYSMDSSVIIFSNEIFEDISAFHKIYGEEIKDLFYKRCFDSHSRVWEKRWKNSGINITGDANAQTCINFALYHLISAGEFSGNHTSIGARALTGISYQGHVFWDTEIFLLPFYLFTAPEIAKALLMYRYNTLNGARENARKEGHMGACFAWESTDSGLEMAPTEIISPYGRVIPIYSSLYEIHITPDIAYAVWQYWQVTHDEDFLVNYGAELIFEAARFCASLLKEGNDELYHIRDVVGPDEYHERVDDNAYTNQMVIHNIDVAVRLTGLLETTYPAGYNKLKEKINLQDKEILMWNEIKEKIFDGYNSETKTHEQFKGYFDLEYIDLKNFEPRVAPMDVILGERTRSTQVIKQADVLMFLFLLANKFSADVIGNNYNYYEPRCSHGSSLSPGIHSLIASRLGKSDDAYRYFMKNAPIDLDDNLGNAAGGVHIASIGSTWISLVMGFAGMYLHEDGLLFDPHLPEQWRKMEFFIQWRGQTVSIKISKDKIRFEITGNQKVNISIGKENWRELAPNTVYSADKDQKWKWNS